MLVSLLLGLSEAYPSTVSKAPAPLVYSEADFRSGDILFRRGRSLLSRAVLSADGAIPYSHVGIVKREAGRVLVIHVEPADQFGGEGFVVAEPLAAFLAADKAASAAIYRPRKEISAVAAAAVEKASAFAARRVPFDGGFDLATENQLYCTELVWRSYLLAGTDLVDGKLDRLQMPLGKERYILPSSLAKSHYLNLVRNLNDHVQETRPDDARPGPVASVRLRQ
jgi:hypothetical protein